MEESVTHILSIGFDDGFKKSSEKTIGIFEKYDLKACLNVIATGHLEEVPPPHEREWWAPKGDFQLWNQYKESGHEIMPHGYNHSNKKEMPFEEAKALIQKCLNYFKENLRGFKAQDSIFNFPYNQSTPELNEWLLTEVRAIRSGLAGINEFPTQDVRQLSTTGYGPDNCERHLDQKISELLDRSGGWLVYNCHGLDDEGWGPIRSSYLDELLARLVKIKNLAILPAGMALNYVS